MRAFVTLCAAIALLLILSPLADAQAYASTDTPLAVADGAPLGDVCGDPGAATVSTINVPDAGTITDLDIFVDIASSWIADVTVVISNGTNSATIISRPGADDATASCGNGSDHFPGIFLDDEGTAGTIEDVGGAPVAGSRYTPNEALSVFDGQSFTGDWTLTITDGGEGDATTLNGWQLLFNGSPPVASEPDALPVGYAFDLLGANPFTARTEFDLQVAASQEVRVVVYDALGREAATLFEGAINAGTPRTVTFNRGTLRAGSYLVRAYGESFDVVQPVTVLR